MSKAPYQESKNYILRGIALLLLGSLCLLLCKMPVPELLSELAAFGGGLLILLGNGLIIYGLLIYAGSREP